MKRSGQVLVLAALMALLLCLVVLSSATLGESVHQRVRLQHTADAAAFSMAATEAKTFNVYAQVNRAHASHYVSAMMWQSLLSHLFFTEAFLTDLVGVAYSFPCLAPAGVWRPLCAVVKKEPAVGATLELLQNVTSILAEVTRTYQDALGADDDAIDRAVGQEVVPSFFEMNAALTSVAQSVMTGTSDGLEEVGRRVTQANDASLNPDAASFDPDGWTHCLFARAHSSAALGRPGEAPADPFTPLSPRTRKDADRIARAKRHMAGVANATRQGCDATAGAGCPDLFLTARTQGIALALPPELAGLRTLLERIPKWGQTRLLSFGMGGANGQNFIREPDGAPDVPTGMLAQGDDLGSDDVYQLPLGPFACRVTDPYEKCWGEPRLDLHQVQHPTDAQRPFRSMLKTSIWALNGDERLQRPGGVHWRVSYPTRPEGPGHVVPQDLGHDHPELQAMGLHEAKRTFFGLAPVSVYVANVRPIQDGHHPWPGIAPFPDFEPGAFAHACEAGNPGVPDDRPAPRNVDFNQPSVWVSLVRKTPSVLDPEGHWARLTGSTETPPHVFSRAQAYYHRPGDWAEQPNFFNPFWHARLAATLQGPGPVPSLQSELDRLPEVLRGQPQRVLTH